MSRIPTKHTTLLFVIYAYFLTSCSTYEPKHSTEINRSPFPERTIVGENPARIALPETMKPTFEGYFPVKGGRLWYSDTGGNAPAVILMHAHTGTHLSWAYQEKPLIEAGYRVIRFSRRGTNWSDAPLIDPDSPVDDLNALLNHLNLKKVHLLGTAGGGMYALRFAIEEPNRVSSLILSCSLGGIKDDGLLTNQKTSFFPSEFSKLPPEFKELSASYRYANIAGVKAWLAIWKGSASHSMSSFSAEEKRAVRLSAMSKAPTRNDLKQLQIPIKLIYGSSDLYAPPSRGRELAENIPSAELVIITEAGHSAHWEQPTVFNKEVIEFLARVK